MKKYLCYLFAGFSILTQSEKVFAQNEPNGSSINLPAPNELVYPLDFNQSPNTAQTKFNYNRSYVPLRPMTSIPSFDNSIGSYVLVNTTYFDGWNRPLIGIVRNGTPNDIVVPYCQKVSDTMANYLPYADSFHLKFPQNVFSRQKDYYSQPVTGFDNIAYSKSVADRGDATSLWTALPGAEMAGRDRGTKTTADFNESGEVYQVYYDAPNSRICKSSTYSANELYVSKTEGYHGEKIHQYTDKLGRNICKKIYAGNGNWLTTYFIYDDFGNLIFIVPPKASQQLISNTCFTDIFTYCFGYEYDESYNLISTRVPGTSDYSRAVYNKNEFLVLTQSPNLKVQNKWLFSIYDKLGRERISGIYTGTETWSYWQGVANGTTSPVTHYYPNSSPVPSSQTLEYWILNGFTGAYPDSLFGCTIHTYNYYDSYNATPANLHTFAENYSSFYQTGPGMETPTPYYLVQGKLVASKIRMLDIGSNHNFTNTSWITNIYFYDEKGRVIQTQTHNPWDNWDTTTLQYNFLGQPVLNLSCYHLWSALNKTHNWVFSRYTYSPTSANLIAVDQMMDKDNIWHSLATYQYDKLGRVITQWMGGDANGFAEVQHYDYNIRNQLSGINKDFFHILGPTTRATYASDLGYEAGMDYNRYDGKLNGYSWQSAGSPVMVYGYLYDTADRITYADYYYESSGSLVKTARDFTVSDIEYDDNGNILKMKQRGPGTSSPVDMDKLYYTYSGNQLLRVVDSGVGSPTVHDFDNGSTGSNNDYLYDANGNLMADANRGIDSIIYNALDNVIRLKMSSNAIDNIYDATGTLLQKKVIDGGNTTIYRYWGPFVCKDDTLEYVLHQEGRCRWLADSSKYKYDFFVTDHQGNVRTTVTKDISEGVSIQGSFEVAYANVEEGMFTYFGELRDYSPTGTPLDMMSARLNGAENDHRIGASLLFHVMAGDEINVKAYGYYENTDSTAMNTYATGESMLTALTDAFAGGSMFVGEGGQAITSQTIEGVLSATNYATYESLKATATDAAYPRTYLNYLVFDENMNILSDECQVIQLKGSANTWNTMELNGDASIGSNGYVLIYFSGESDMDTWIDNIHFVTIKGRLLQTQHYYPHGLIVENSLQNGEKFNDYLFEGNRLQNELNQGISDFNFRDYDQQIGRFMNVDPLAEHYGQYSLTPYHFAGNDPANFTDPLGLARLPGAQVLHGHGSWRISKLRALLQDLWELAAGLFESDKPHPSSGGGSTDANKYQVIVTVIPAKKGYEGNGQSPSSDNGGRTPGGGGGGKLSNRGPKSDCPECFIGLGRQYSPSENDMIKKKMEFEKRMTTYPGTQRTSVLQASPQNNRKVYVYIWDREDPDKKDDLGHTAIRIDNSIYGFYGTTSIYASRGQMKVHNMKTFQDDYWDDGITGFELNLTPDQINLLEKNLQKIKQTPGVYSIFNRQCTSVAIRALMDAGVKIEGVVSYHGNNNVTPWQFSSILSKGSNRKLIKRKFRFKVNLKTQ